MDNIEKPEVVKGMMFTISDSYEPRIAFVPDSFRVYHAGFLWKVRNIHKISNSPKRVKRQLRMIKVR